MFDQAGLVQLPRLRHPVRWLFAGAQNLNYTYSAPALELNCFQAVVSAME